MKTTKKVSIIVGTILILSIGWGYLEIWRSPEFVLEENSCGHFKNVLTMEEYGQLSGSHSRPFILNGQNVLIFGSEHTNDPSDPQIEELESAFLSFRPSVVLVEGRLGFLIPYVMDPVSRYEEMGKAAELAKQHRLQLYSWDAPKSEQIKALQKEFSPEQIVLKEILNPYFGNLRHGKPASPENYVEEYLHRANWLGLQDKFKSIDDIDKIWEIDFPSEKNWRDISDQWGLPGYLGKIADHSNMVRNQHLLCAIQGLIDRGERVFVVCGSSHAVCIQEEIR